MIRIKRVYAPYEASDGRRFLIERLWPRGIRKTDLVLDGWLRDVAPSAELRRWFGHEPAKWDGFRQRYRAELEAVPGAWQPLLDAASLGPLTLLYSARDTAHNSAVVLRDYLRERLEQA